MKTSLALLILLAAAAPAAAQQADPRWTRWIGCWEMDNGTAEVCIAPATGGGVTLATRVEGEPALEQTIVADGAPHPVAEAGCSGAQRAEWSADGRRLFARAELTCPNQPARRVSGLAMITPDGAWLDVQGIEVEGNTTVRVRRYRRAGTRAAAAQPFAAPPEGGAPFGVDAVRDASGKVSVAVLEAALTETAASFRLTARDLVALDEAGVPDSVIDLMIAQSYPEKFQVERRADANVDLYPPSFADASWSGYWGLGYPYFSWYPGYYGNYRYFYSPFGYAYSGLYGPYSYYYPRSVVVIDGGDAPSSAAAGEGRAVNGVGYTRVRPRDAVSAESGGGQSAASGSGRGTLGPAGYTRSGGGDGSASSGSGSSGSSGSSGGASSGGSDGGRVAVPR